MEAVFARAKNRHSLEFCSNTKIASRMCNVEKNFIFHALVFSAINKQGLPSVVSIMTHCVERPGTAAHQSLKPNRGHADGNVF